MTTGLQLTASDTHVTIHPVLGSAQHYFHFLLGFLLPLVHALRPPARRDGFILVRSCAVMDPLLLQSRIPRLVIMPAAVHDAVREQCVQKLTLTGFDVPDRCDSRISEARDLLLERLQPAVNEKRWELLRWFKADGPRTLLIQRARLHAFYASDASEARSSGAQRRSIPNLDAVVEAVRQVHDNLAVTMLEDTPLVDQISLFSIADIVIAQHGAALGNMVWMRRGTCVIEITSKQLEPLLAKHDFYGRLARLLEIRLIRVAQESDHAPVTVGDLTAAVASAMARVGFG